MRELQIRMTRSAFETLGVAELLALREECEAVRFRSLACRGSSGTLMIEVCEPVETDRYEALEYIHSFDLVGRGPDRFEYLVDIELPRCRDELDEQEGEFYVDGPLHLDDEGLTFTAIATQDALDRLDEAFGGVEDFASYLEVLHIREYGGRSDRVDALTARQREVLTMAFEREYFEVPRGVTAAELADELDLDKSTVLEHLRRAERNLLDRVIGSGPAELAP